MVNCWVLTARLENHEDNESKSSTGNTTCHTSQTHKNYYEQLPGTQMAFLYKYRSKISSPIGTSSQNLIEDFSNKNYFLSNANELFKTCLMLDVISFMKYIRSSFLSLNRVPSS